MVLLTRLFVSTYSGMMGAMVPTGIRPRRWNPSGLAASKYAWIDERLNPRQWMAGWLFSFGFGGRSKTGVWWMRMRRWRRATPIVREITEARVKAGDDVGNVRERHGALFNYLTIIAVSSATHPSSSPPLLCPVSSSSCRFNKI